MWIRRPHHLYTLTLTVSVAASFAILPAEAAKPTYAHKMEMGQLLYFNGDLDRSIKAFKDASELNDKAFEPHLNLVNLYVQKGGDDGLAAAANECSEVLKRKPNNKDVHLILGNLLRTQAGNETDPEKMKEKLTEAAKEVETAEEMGASKAMCENTIGLIELQRGDNDKALAHINNALEKQPVFADAHLVRAVLLFKNLMSGGTTPAPADSKASDAKSSDSTGADNKDGGTKSGDAKSADGKTGDTKSGDSQTSEGTGSDAKSSHTDSATRLEGGLKVTVKNKSKNSDKETDNKRTRHHASRQVRQAGTTQTRSYSATSTETLAPQTINVPIKVQSAIAAPSCPATVVTQPAVVQEMVQPAIVEEHRNILPYLLVGGALLATAIAVPLSVTGHHHRRNDLALRQQQLLLFSRPTP